MRSPLMFAALIAATSPASADWQGFRWGQTLEETLAQPNVEEIPEAKREGLKFGDGSVGLAQGKRTVAGGEREPIFYFVDSKLSLITIAVSLKYDFSRAQTALEDVFGPPAILSNIGSTCEYASRVWFDREGGNRFEYRTSGCGNGEAGTAEIRIVPLQTRASAGF